VSTINHIGVSGGKDSTALLLWAKYESGYDPETIVASFCDTANEHQWTYDHVAMLAERVHPIIGITPERGFYELADHKKRFPGARSRFCTEHLKMIPTKAFVEHLASDGSEVLMHSGVRANESDDRALLEEREEGWLSWFGFPTYRPLLRWTIADVWAIHERYGMPPNPLYAAGCKRVGCLPCCMSRKAEIANIADQFPERIDMIRDAEQSNGNRNGYSSFFPRRTVPLKWRDKIIKAKTGEKMAVATIDGVVKWARNDANRYTEEFDFYDESPLACDSRYGACE
jgi:3'-phosphoadenosine 5'-phosphosulfate sulfotransferase (PAPS reductase)/FAD synthetase